MRAQIFRLILDRLEHRRSGLAARLQIQVLMGATAKAFRKKGRFLLLAGDPLREYAAFSKICMETRTEHERLYGIAYRIGRRLREISGLTDPEDLKRFVFLLYRNIGISMTGDIPGILTISSCYFSTVYTARECAEISAMDSGIVAGICGDGTLVFTKRLTEGCDHCTACFTRER